MLNGVVVFLSVLVVLVANSVVQTQAQQEWQMYEDLEGRFTIEFPSDWYVNEEPSDDKEGVVQFDSSEPDLESNEDRTMPSVRLVIRNAEPDETSLESLSNKRVNTLASFTTIEESENTTLSGLPAYTIKTSGGILDNSKQVWTLHDGKVYHIIYAAHSYDYEIYLPTFQHMIESFHIT